MTTPDTLEGLTERVAKLERLFSENSVALEQNTQVLHALVENTQEIVDFYKEARYTYRFFNRVYKAGAWCLQTAAQIGALVAAICAAYYYIRGIDLTGLKK